MIFAYIVDAYYNNSSYFIKKDTVTRIWHHRSLKKLCLCFYALCQNWYYKKGYRYWYQKTVSLILI